MAGEAEFAVEGAAGTGGHLAGGAGDGQQIGARRIVSGVVGHQLGAGRGGEVPAFPLDDARRFLPVLLGGEPRGLHQMQVQLMQQLLTDHEERGGADPQHDDGDGGRGGEGQPGAQPAARPPAAPPSGPAPRQAPHGRSSR
ncbi:hypothetical protein [Streptomyces murinus]|uniref:hypothetical protein n=1 Tax=Streptomyces murinus TaxID=33900 RepID=UPI0037F57718